MTKSKLTTIILLLMTIVLMAAIFIVGFIITRPPETPSMVAPRKTKAQSVTYNRTIAFNTVTPTISPTAMVSPSPSPTSAPTPTEIILARINTPTQSTSVSATINPTKTTGLPETGTISNALFIFGAAGLLIFFSFLF